jgi:hypothetical protein
MTNARDGSQDPFVRVRKLRTLPCRSPREHISNTRMVEQRPHARCFVLKADGDGKIEMLARSVLKGGAHLIGHA